MGHNISPRFTQVELEAKTDRDKTIISLETDHTVEIEINHIEAKEITIETIDQIIEVDHKTTIDMTIGEATIDMMIGEITTDKMIAKTIIGQIIEEIITEENYRPNYGRGNHREQRYRTRSEIGRILEIFIGIIQEKDLIKVEIEAEIGVEKDKHDQDQEHCWKMEMIGQDQSLDLDQIQE